MLTEDGEGALALQLRPQGALQPGTDIERLRADREEHRHRQIWTKLPHGGPYRKVSGGPAGRLGQAAGGGALLCCPTWARHA